MNGSFFGGGSIAAELTGVSLDEGFSLDEEIENIPSDEDVGLMPAVSAACILMGVLSQLIQQNAVAEMNAFLKILRTLLFIP